MMFAKQIAFIDSLENILNSEIQKAIYSYGFVIKDYIVNKQLFQQGVDANGKRLRGYTRTTIRIKIAKGQPSDRTTLKDEGAFHASIQVDAYDDSFVITSDVPYDKYLLDPAESSNAYGFDAMKPSVGNMSEFFKNYILPSFRKTVSESLR